MSALTDARQERPPPTGTRLALATAAPRHRRDAYRQLAAVGAGVLIVAALVAWLLVRERGVDRPAVTPVQPTLVSQAGLRRVAAAAGHPLYWAGPRSGYSYELTVTTSGRVFVRYLPAGVAAGDQRDDFLTVGTYPDPDAYEHLERAAARSDTTSVRVLEGGLAVGSSRTLSNAYLAYPGAKYQVETFDPAGDAWGLTVGGAVAPVR